MWMDMRLDAVHILRTDYPLFDDNNLLYMFSSVLNLTDSRQVSFKLGTPAADFTLPGANFTEVPEFIQLKGSIHCL